LINGIASFFGGHVGLSTCLSSSLMAVYSLQGWLKAQASKATALGLKVLKASKKFNML